MIKKSIELNNIIKVLIKISLFLFPIFITLYIVGFNSSYLINNVLKILFLVLSIITLIINIIGIVITKFNILKPVVFYIILSIYVIGAISFNLLIYGPYKGFLDWLITTAMGTMNHQYYCKIFYNDKIIEESKKRNYLIEPDGETDGSLVNKEIDLNYDNEYEKNIFKGHTKKEDYRIIRFKVNGQDAYLAVIYKPELVSVAYTSKIGYNGEYVTSMAKRTNSRVAINGGGFLDTNHDSTGGIPLGVTISNNKIVRYEDNLSFQGIIGLNQDNVLVLLKYKSAQETLKLGIRDCVTAGPFLIVNGKSASFKGNGGFGYDARTAIGQRDDGIILLLVVDANDTRTNGASMVDLMRIMENYGAINAAALDGGTSSVMVENGELINDPINSSFEHRTRPVATAFVVK